MYLNNPGSSSDQGHSSLKSQTGETPDGCSPSSDEQLFDKAHQVLLVMIADEWLRFHG